jgi:hypothetical protein
MSITQRFKPKLGPPKPTAQQRVLSEWRKIDLAAAERSLANPAKGLGAIIPQVLTSLGLDRRQAEAELIKAWNQLIDPNITAHAQPSGLVKGTLFVTVDHSVWLSEIVRYRRREILDRLQNCFGPDLIRKISFRVG